MFNILFIIMDIMFGVLLIVCSITDLKKRIVPNECIILLLLLGITHAVFKTIIGYVWWYHFIGLVYSIPFFIAWHKELMGAGDVKLIIVISLYLGIINSLLAFIIMLLCLFIWAIYAKAKSIDTKKSIPLAPFISAGFILFLCVKYL